jgi:hypothetical protein
MAGLKPRPSFYGLLVGCLDETLTKRMRCFDFLRDWFVASEREKRIPRFARNDDDGLGRILIVIGVGLVVAGCVEERSLVGAGTSLAPPSG